MHVPQAPPRPPGPYERATLVASYLQRFIPAPRCGCSTHPRHPVQARPFPRLLGGTPRRHLRSPSPNRTARRRCGAPDPGRGLQAALGGRLNVIPPHRAAPSRARRRPADGERWCPGISSATNRAPYPVARARRRPGGAPGMPKSGHMANQQPRWPPPHHGRCCRPPVNAETPHSPTPATVSTATARDPRGVVHRYDPSTHHGHRAGAVDSLRALRTEGYLALPGFSTSSTTFWVRAAPPIGEWLGLACHETHRTDRNNLSPSQPQSGSTSTPPRDRLRGAAHRRTGGPALEAAASRPIAAWAAPRGGAEEWYSTGPCDRPARIHGRCP